MTYHESLARREDYSSGTGVWTIIGGVALAALAWAVIANLPDIKRYIRISTM